MNRAEPKLVPFKLYVGFLFLYREKKIAKHFSKEFLLKSKMSASLTIM